MVHYLVIEAALSKTTVSLPLVRCDCSSWEDTSLDNGQESRCRSVIHLHHKRLFGTTLTTSEDPACILSSSSVILSFSEGRLVYFYDLPWTSNRSQWDAFQSSLNWTITSSVYGSGSKRAGRLTYLDTRVEGVSESNAAWM